MTQWWFCPQVREQASLTLFCFPHGGATANHFREWANKLLPEVELQVLQLPGRAKRFTESNITDLECLVDEIIESLIPWLDKPFCFFGHSIGAVVINAVIDKLQQSAYPLPLHCFVSAHKPPITPDSDGMHLLTDNELTDELCRWGLLKRELLTDPGNIDVFIKPVRDDFALVANYQLPTEPLSIPLSIYYGNNDELVTAQDMRAWQQHSHHPIIEHCFTGGHFYFDEHPNQFFTMFNTQLSKVIDPLPQAIVSGETRDYPLNKGLHQLFREAAQQFPQRTAVIDQQRSFSYQQLDQYTDALASQLLNHQVKQNDLVAIYMPKSAFYVLSMLGILKANAAYLTLDWELPQHKIITTLEKTNIDCLITINGEHCAALSPHLKVIQLSRQWLNENNHPVELDIEYLNQQFHPQQLAYSVLTSGTTGEPKIILCPHQGAVNSYYYRYQYFPYLNDEREACYIFFIWEVLRPLLQGISAYIISDEAIADPKILFQYLITNKITRTLLTPSMAQAIMTELKDEHDIALPNLGYLYLNGEVLTKDLLALLKKVLPDTRIINDYSISECHDISHSDISHYSNYASLVPVGKPMPNVKIMILNKHQQLLRQGQRGEIYIGGASLAKGYLANVKETQKRFIQNPLTTADERIFRTGDCGYINHLGELVIQGRSAFMIKLRGFSIVPEAVATTISNIEGINNAYVKPIFDTKSHQPIALAAFCVKNKNIAIDKHGLNQRLRELLPSHEVPQHIVFLNNMPISDVSGKIDPEKLSLNQFNPSVNDHQFKQYDELTQLVIQTWQETLGVPINLNDAHFFDLGGHSISAIELACALSKKCMKKVSVVDIYQSPKLTDFLATLTNTKKINVKQKEAKSKERIAIIGMAIRVPGANNVVKFWDNLTHGIESIQTLTTQQSLEEGLSEDLLQRQDYVNRAALLDNVYDFDHQFWGISKAEAKLIDPQQRIFIELCYTALESSGYKLDTIEALTGIYGGMAPPSYWLNMLKEQQSRAHTDPLLQHLLEVGNDKDYLATRVAHLFNLKGPAITVQTSCSTGLSTVIQAAQGLQQGNCHVALAGSVSLTFPRGGYIYNPAHVLSPDGHCNSFSNNANGTLLGEGAGVIVLKRLSDAQRDGDNIFAVIEGFASNNDGLNRASFSAPSSEGQAQVILQALNNSGVKSKQIGYVEAHGTGTLIGDPIEVRALTQAFNQDNKVDNQSCALGTVKPNVGHSNIAAGMVGLIKTVLCLHHKTFVPTINCRPYNPELQLSSSPFCIVEQTQHWESSQTRRAGVSSFGVGGTNCHVILKEYDHVRKTVISNKNEEPQLICLSAVSEDTFPNQIADFKQYCRDNPDISLELIAYYLQTKRKHYQYRYAFWASSLAEVINHLDEHAVNYEKANKNTSKTVGFFPGQGCHYFGMGQALYSQNEFFRQQVDNCLELLPLEITSSVTRYWQASPTVNTEQQTFEDPCLLQLCLFILEYSLAKTWLAKDVSFDILLGYSLGEFVAATIAGVMSLKDALFIIHARAQALQQFTGQGSLIAIKMQNEAVKTYCEDLPTISLAIINADNDVIIGGNDEELNILIERLEDNNIESRKINVDYPFHTKMLMSSAEIFLTKIADIEFNIPTIPLLSNVTGTYYSTEQAINAKYWYQHLIQTVHFQKNLTEIKEFDAILIELGPGISLKSLLAISDKKMGTKTTWICSQPHPKASELVTHQTYLQQQLAKFWRVGGTVEWPNRDVTVSLPEPLPATRFRNTYCKIEPETKQLTTKSYYTYTPHWLNYDNQKIHLTDTHYCLLLMSQHDYSHYQDFILWLGAQYKELEVIIYDGHIDGQYCKALNNYDYENYLLELNNEPQQIIVIAASKLTLADNFLHCQTIFKVLSDNRFSYRPLLRLIMNNDYANNIVTTPLVTQWLVFNQEYPHYSLQCLDVDNPNNQTWWSLCLQRSSQLQLKIQLDSVLQLDYLTFELPENLTRPLAGQVWLITGGLGRIGMSVVEFLIANKANVIITTRQAVTSQASWQQGIWQKLAELSEQGNLAVYQQPWQSSADIDQFLAEINNQYGKIDVIVHAAGNSKLCSLADSKADYVKQLFQSKISTLDLLVNSIKNMSPNNQPRTVVLMSSMAAILGGYHMAAYGTANRYFDCIQDYINHQVDTRFVCLDWDDWDFDYEEEQVIAYQNTVKQFAFQPQLAINILLKLININSLNHCLICNRPLPKRLEQWCSPNVNSHKLEKSHTECFLPKDPIEIIHQSYQTVLDIEQPIDFQDNFFDLGGDSLLAGKLLSYLQQHLPDVNWTLTVLMSYSSITELAEWLTEQGK